MYILLTKCEGCTGRISVLHVSLDSMDQVRQGPYRKDRGRYSPSMDPNRLGNKTKRLFT